MRKIFLLVFTLISLSVFGQFPNDFGISNSKTQYYVKGGMGADSSFIFRTAYADTTAANRGFQDAIPGCIIRTTGGFIWMRNDAATAWIYIGGSAGGGTNIYNSDGTLTGNRNLYINSNDLSFYSGGIASSKVLYFSPTSNYIGNPTSTRQLLLYPDSVLLVNTDQSASSSDSVLVRTSTGRLKTRAQSQISATIPISSLLAATVTNDIDNTNYTQTWRWTGTTLNALELYNSTTASLTNTRTLYVSRSGAHASSNRQTFAGQFANAHTGTNSTNIGISGIAGAGTINKSGYFAASTAGTTNYAIQAEWTTNGGTDNYGGHFTSSGVGTNNIAGYFSATNGTSRNDAIIVPSGGGSVGIGTSSPSAKLHVSGTTRFDLGSDATGDMFYRDASGFFTRLAVGGAGQHLVGGTTPHWVDTAAGGGGTNIYNSDGTITAERTINGGGNNIIWQNFAEHNITADDFIFQVTELGGGVSSTRFQLDSTSGVAMYPYKGRMKIDSLNYTLSTTGKKLLIRDTATGIVENIDPSLIGGSGSPAGNFGNIQLNRNGSFATPASDSLDFESATGLSVKGGIRANAASDASTSTFNPQLTVFNSGGNYYGLSLLYQNSRFRTAFYCAQGADVGIGVMATGATALSDFAEIITVRGDNSRVGILEQNPTALLHIKAGTASANTAPLKLTTGTSLTTAEAGAFEYSTPQLFFTNGGAVRQELFQGNQNFVQTQFDKTSNTTLGNVTNLSVNVAAGKAYRFEAILYTSSNVAGGVKAAIGGTATATTIIYEGLTTDAGLTTQSRATSLGTAVGAVTAVTAAYIKITGTIIVNAAGTLTVQFAQNASNGSASSVLVGSTFHVIELAYFP